MSKAGRNIIRSFLIIILSIVFAVGFYSPGIYAAVANWQQGASIQSRGIDDFSSPTFRQSLLNLKATGADYATFIIQYYQSNLYSTDIQRGWNTPSDTALISAIQYAHSIGMKVMLKPHIDAINYDWRANIDPQDRDTWFKNYGDMLVHYARIAQTHGVEQLCIGAELYKMTSTRHNSTNAAQWSGLIAKVRAVYSGPLLYSAQHSGDRSEKFEVDFWSQLDAIGLSAYFPLASDKYYVSMQELLQSWDNVNSYQVRPLWDTYQKPIIFTEVGYKSVSGSHRVPGDWSIDGPYDEAAQAQSYDALFTYWNNHSYIHGVHWWDWNSDPNYGGHGNRDYTPQGKEAENIMKKWFTGGSGGEDPVPPPTQPGDSDLTITTTPLPDSIEMNKPATITGIFTSKTAVNNILLDLEVYNQSGQKVAQKYLDNQQLAANTGTNMSLTWTPSDPGTYTIRAGIFTAGWTRNLVWNNSVGTLVVKSSGESDETPPVTPPVDTTPPTVSFTAPANDGATLQGTASVSVSAHDASGISRVKFFLGETELSVDESEPFTASINTTSFANGTYTLRAVAYDTAGNSATATRQVTISNTAPPAPEPTKAVMNIWWPGDGVNVSGVQPFKAMLENMSLDHYDMYWQVDNGMLNRMNDSFDDYPHKAARVNLEPWKWNANGVYRVNFVAKNKQGETLVQKHIAITVQ
jgi:hypothetical protein